MRQTNSNRAKVNECYALNGSQLLFSEKDRGSQSEEQFSLVSLVANKCFEMLVISNLIKWFSSLLFPFLINCCFLGSILF